MHLLEKLQFLVLIIKKTFSYFYTNFGKVKKAFCLSLHYNGFNSYLYAGKTESFKLKMHDNMCWYEFYLWSVLKDFNKDESV